MATSKQTIGTAVEFGGFGAIAVGVALCFHHLVIVICLTCGAAAAYVGKNLRASS